MCTACLLTISQHALCRGLVFVSQHALAGVSEKAGVYLPRGCLPRRVPAWGVCMPRGVPAQGCTGRGCAQVGVPAWGCLPWGVPAQGVSAQGSVPPQEVYLSEGCIPACNGADAPLWTDRHL